MRPKLLPCPFDGGTAAYDHHGTCMDVNCQDCGIGFSVQLSDLMEIGERLAMTFDVNKKDFGYPQEIIHRVQLHLAEQWNRRTLLTDAPESDKVNL